MATRKKKRKATPAQLRALAKGRAVMKKRRAQKRKAPKRKKVARRRNPAYGNYQKARAVARGSRRVNPVKSTYYTIRRRGYYFTGDGFSADSRAAALFQSVKAAKRVAQKLADRTGDEMAIKRRGE